MSHEINLSIIVPVYNTDRYLRECLDSIVNLSINNYEIIIVNDGSTDSSENIIHEYEENYQNISYYYQENNGQGSARNLALKVAKGEYIYFMDSDDKLIPDKFVTIFNEAKKNNLDSIFFDADVFLDESALQSKSNLPDFKYTREKSYGFYSNGEELFYSLAVNRDFYVSPCLYIVKHSIYTDNKLSFPLNMKNEDEIFSVKLMFYLGECLHINANAFMRRVRLNSTMTSMQIESKFANFTKIVTDLSDFYNKFSFRSEKGKKQLYKRIEGLYIESLKIFSQTNLPKSDINYKIIIETAKKYNYYSAKGKLATININLFVFLQRVYLNIKNLIWL